MKKFKEHLNEAEYDGRKVTLNKPFRSTDKKKKFYVYVKNEKGNVIKLGFGDPGMEIKRDDPGRRKNFRARHQCDTDPGPKWKARYWSCKFWEPGKSVTDLLDDVQLEEDTLYETPFAVDTIKYGETPGVFTKGIWKFKYRVPTRPSPALGVVDDGDFIFKGTYGKALKALHNLFKKMNKPNIKQAGVELDPRSRPLKKKK
ncbi:MAG TPA: hypothetical protein DHV22_05005 [Xanthomarina gelatinilytica]|uniref:Uncharacterized protein n=1 Tax=Xanthomarina gelatinilytica TaxID=1137281 RepID=A0A3D6BQT6_9FLAO|nr:hypothetical protein [Xanthomarina gelatinilytica]